MEKDKMTTDKLDSDNLRELISNWSSIKIDGNYLDLNLRIREFPLSWFYRPILYSNLLPKPFVTTYDYLSGKKVYPILGMFSFIFKKYLVYADFFRSLIRGKKKHKSNENKILILNYSNFGSFRERKIKEILDKNNYKVLNLYVDPLSSISTRGLFTKKTMIYDYYDSSIHRMAKSFSIKINKIWQQYSLNGKKKMFMGNHNNLYDFFHGNINFLYSTDFLYLTSKFYYTFLKILKKEKIKSIILSSQNNIFEKTIIAAANYLKIPVFVIQHGIALGTLPTIETPTNVFFTVFSKKYKKELIKLGVKSTNICVTGPIIFDGIEKYIQSKMRNNIRVNTDVNIFFATSPIVEDRYMSKSEYFIKVKSFLGKLNNFNCKTIIKLHPREKNLKQYQRIVNDLNLPAIISQVNDRDAHYKLISGSDLVITYGSTVGLESIIIGKRTINLEMFDGLNPSNDIIRSSPEIPKIHYSDIIDIKKIMGIKISSRYKLVKNLCFKIDGKASERVVDYINYVIENIT